jgi:hypothetical protein
MQNCIYPNRILGTILVYASHRFLCVPSDSYASHRFLCVPISLYAFFFAKKRFFKAKYNRGAQLGSFATSIVPKCQNH